MDLDKMPDVLTLLAQTYNRYRDRPSRIAVELVLADVVQQSSPATLTDSSNSTSLSLLVLEWLAAEVGRLLKHGSESSVAPNNVYLLLSWHCVLYKNWDISRLPAFQRARLLETLAALFAHILALSNLAKAKWEKNALRKIRQALDSSPQSLVTTITTLLAISNGSATPLVTFPLLGMALDASIRLDAVQGIRRLSDSIKETILSLYVKEFLAPKTPVPMHVAPAFQGFIHNYCLPEDLSTTILPVAEKVLLRSPEHSLSVLKNFFTAYAHPLDETSFGRLFSPILACAKSTSSSIRKGSVDVLVAILSHRPALAIQIRTVTELLSLPKRGKSSSADHRTALYSMLASVDLSPSASTMIVETAIPLLVKEVHEAATSALSSVLPTHINFLLDSDTQIPEVVALIIPKEMISAKVGSRALYSTLGSALLLSSDLKNGSYVAFARAILPCVEKTLLTSHSTSLSEIRLLETYVAIALLLGPLHRSGKFDDAVARNSTIQALQDPSIKPHFFMWDKVYKKLSGEEDELWLLRAVEATFFFLADDLLKNDSLRHELGMILLQLAIQGRTFRVKQAVSVTLQGAVCRLPVLASSLIREALTYHVSQGPITTALPNLSGEQSKKLSGGGGYPGFLLCSAAFDARLDMSTREQLVAELIVLGHHCCISPLSRQIWIDLCQKAGVNPHNLVDQHLETLCSVVFKYLTSNFQQFVDACQNAVKTIAFVSPQRAIPELVELLCADIHPTAINSLSERSLSIWSTPPGTLYINPPKSDGNISRKDKDSEEENWNEKHQKPLTKRGASNPKQDQNLMRMQLDEQSRIREQIALLVSRTRRGIALLRGLIAAHMSEFGSYMTRVISILMDGILGANGRVLFRNLGYEIYMELSICCSERLGSLRKFIGVAILRSLQNIPVPEELQAEPISSLFLRVLYELRSLAEQLPFDLATFSYSFPLLQQVLMKEGSEDNAELEPIALALDIINFHRVEFEDLSFPRSKIMECVLHVLRRQPQVMNSASSLLIGIAGSVCTNAAPTEISPLIRGTLAQETQVRKTCLQTLQPFDLVDLGWSPELWVAMHDEDDQNAALALRLWGDNDLEVPENFFHGLVGFLDHPIAYVRTSSSAAIANAATLWSQVIPAIHETLQEIYRAKAKASVPEFDEYGLLVEGTPDGTDPRLARFSVARVLRLLAPHLSVGEVELFFDFLLQSGALGDDAADVRAEMLAAGTAMISGLGPEPLAKLIGLLEEHLGAAIPASAADHIKEGVVVLLGSAASHLSPADPRIPSIVARLVRTLETPSEQVQIALSECLASLIKPMGSDVHSLADQLFDQVFRAPKYAARRGAAHGLSGFIKGRGVSGMKGFNVMSRLQIAIEDKKNYESRQGSMFLAEALCSSLGRLFEPFVPHVLPLLLACFGDSVADVRDAAHDATRVIMAHMSRYGVKLMLPPLLLSLEEKQWRTKKGSIELLGMMAYCSPRQLSLSLPIVIPRLNKVLTEPHAQVRSSAKRSLEQFGAVISNPEVRFLAPVLMKALADPAKIPDALNSLLKTSFTHYIDQSSLALLIPIVDRGLRERSADTKKKATQIVGNLASLAITKDFVPYLFGLLPLVHTVLVDPVPEARATAAKALGTLVERLGENHFPNLVPDLLKNLKTSTSGVDRLGAAQGLSEVLSGLGMERLEQLLPDIINSTQSLRSTVREGFMWLLVYLPATFGSRFHVVLPKIISPIISGLADAEEPVREAAMRAGRTVVTDFSSQAVDVLLPELEAGVFDSNWRIRQSSVTLVGELLFKISGISSNAQVEEHDETSEASGRALSEILGSKRRNRILSALFVIRQDDVSTVRQASIHVWQVLVHNTNTRRTVRELLPELMDHVVSLISSDEVEQQEMAGRTVTELSQKFGVKSFMEVVRILRQLLESLNPRLREGCCLTICQLMESSTESQREGSEDDIVDVVRASLVDGEMRVRSAAAKAFDVLQEQIGERAIDRIIPTLLETLRQPGEGSGTALQALKEVMAVRASTIFPILIPTLISPPITEFDAHALGSLVTVAGNTLNAELPKILTSLTGELENDGLQAQLRRALIEALYAVFTSINDPETLDILMLSLLDWMEHGTDLRRANTCKYFARFCETSQLDLSIYQADWIRQLLTLFMHRDLPLRTAACDALDVFVNSFPKEKHELLVVPLRRAIESIGSPNQVIHGFSLRNGISSIAPIIIAGLTVGTSEQREQAAYAISDLVERAEDKAIKPFVVPFTGPLIRVATQSTTYTPAVKVAILTALMTMLTKIPDFVRPFFPQLQRTFLRSASDPTSFLIRSRAAKALDVLMQRQPRIEPVINELVALVRSSDDEVARSLIISISNVIKSAGAGFGEKGKSKCLELISDAFARNPEENYSQAIALLTVSLAQFPELLEPVLHSHLSAQVTPTVLSSRVLLALLSPSLESSSCAAARFSKDFLLGDITNEVLAGVTSKNSLVAESAREANELLHKLVSEGLQSTVV